MYGICSFVVRPADRKVYTLFTNDSSSRTRYKTSSSAVADRPLDVSCLSVRYLYLLLVTSTSALPLRTIKFCFLFFSSAFNHAAGCDKQRFTDQGRTQEGADGAKAPAPRNLKKNNYLLIQIRNILCFAVCTKKSVSQSFYNNRFYWLRCWSGTLRCVARLLVRVTYLLFTT